MFPIFPFGNFRSEISNQKKKRRKILCFAIKRPRGGKEKKKIERESSAATTTTTTATRRRRKKKEEERRRKEEPLARDVTRSHSHLTERARNHRERREKVFKFFLYSKGVVGYGVFV